MKVTVLGSGHIGGTLGKKWAQAGHTVQFGVRDPHKAEVQDLLKSLGGNASAASVPEAIASGEVVVFAIPGRSMDETIRANARALDGKTIVDTTNNMGAEVVNSLPSFAAHAPQAQVFRAFNTLGWENFADPQYGDVAADLFYCGPEGEARPQVERLISDVGLRPVYLGGPEQAGLVDDVLKLWFTLASGQKWGRGIAFKVLTR